MQPRGAPRTIPDIPSHRYGLCWFIWPHEMGATYYARGFGGQVLYICPAHALTVAITSDVSRPARPAGYVATLHALYQAAILPAASA